MAAPVRMSAGFTAVPDHGREILAAADAVVVPEVHGGTALDDGTLEPPVAAAPARRLLETTDLPIDQVAAAPAWARQRRCAGIRTPP